MLRSLDQTIGGNNSTRVLVPRYTEFCYLCAKCTSSARKGGLGRDRFVRKRYKEEPSSGTSLPSFFRGGEQPSVSMAGTELVDRNYSSSADARAVERSLATVALYCRQSQRDGRTPVTTVTPPFCLGRYPAELVI